MRKFLVLVLLIYSYSISANQSNTGAHIEHDKSHAKLEIKLRDEAIKELTSILLFQYQDFTKNELVSTLRKHPNAVKFPNYVSVENDFVLFGATTKFEFKNGKLIKVYW